MTLHLQQTLHTQNKVETNRYTLLCLNFWQNVWVIWKPMIFRRHSVYITIYDKICWGVEKPHIRCRLMSLHNGKSNQYWPFFTGILRNQCGGIWILNLERKLCATSFVDIYLLFSTLLVSWKAHPARSVPKNPHLETPVSLLKFPRSSRSSDPQHRHNCYLAPAAYSEHIQTDCALIANWLTSSQTVSIYWTSRPYLTSLMPKNPYTR